MATIKDNKTYKAMMQRIETLMEEVEEYSPMSDPRVAELDILTELVEEYENTRYPIATPSLPDVIKLRMYEMDLTQEKLAEMLGLSQPVVSGYLNGKAEPTLKTARSISKFLNIEPGIVLGV
jgi:Predicted transcription regulator containing HTH domain